MSRDRRAKHNIHALDTPLCQPGQPLPARWPWLIAAVLWCGFIVATSSTVILAPDFFAWVATHVVTNEALFRKFATFWGYSWFAIVKGWHAAEFAILFTVLLMALDRLTGSVRRRNVAIVVAFSLVFAVLDEYHQRFVPGRGGTWTDVGIDALGVFGAVLIAWHRRPSDDG